MVVFGTGMGLTQARPLSPLWAPSRTQGWRRSAVNDATRLFGGTLGVAVIGTAAASLHTSPLAATLPARLPARAITAVRDQSAAPSSPPRKPATPGSPSSGPT